MKSIFYICILLSFYNEIGSKEKAMKPMVEKFYQLPNSNEKESFFNSLEPKDKFEILQVFLVSKVFVPFPTYSMKFLSKDRLLFSQSTEYGEKNPKKINGVGIWKVEDDKFIIVPAKKVGIQNFKNPDLFIDAKLLYNEKRGEFILKLKRANQEENEWIGMSEALNDIDSFFSKYKE